MTYLAIEYCRREVNHIVGPFATIDSAYNWADERMKRISGIQKINTFIKVTKLAHPDTILALSGKESGQ